MILGLERSSKSTRNIEALKVGSAKHSKEANLLQSFIFPSSPDNADLYMRKLGGEVIYGEQIGVFDRAHLSFNTYFNSFYEDYWVGGTSLDAISLRIVGEGLFWCNIFRETKALGCALIARVRVRLGDEVDHVSIAIPLVTRALGHGGRIFVDLEVEAPTLLSSMDWTTDQPALNRVAIGVGICTFNREPFLTRTVGQLIDAPAIASVEKIVVINQGGALGSDPFKAVSKRAGPRLSVVEQANFGGAGGFTRSAMELIEQEGLTHVLFMDDDIQLDARHLIPTAAFLRYAKDRVLVGGHMLDLFRRHMLYEAGNTITPDNQLRPNHHNLDLNLLPSLTALSQATPSHFNGWWYTVIPVSCFEDFGLPTPIFIRGDDLEFGTRLHQLGVSTISLPPVSVWHEPFYAKAPGWQLYYDLRNRLIFASLYPQNFSLDSPARLAKLLMVHLIRYDYQTAWLMMQAIIDFLAGPSLLEEGMEQTHQRVTKGAAAFAPKRIASRLGLDAANADVPKTPWRIRAQLLSSFGRALLGLPRARPYGVQYTDVPLQWVKLAGSYVLSNRDGHFFLGYTYSRDQTWRHLLQTGAALLRYRRERDQAASTWRAGHQQLISKDAWRKVFGLDESRETSAEAA